MLMVSHRAIVQGLCGLPRDLCCLESLPCFSSALRRTTPRSSDHGLIEEPAEAVLREAGVGCREARASCEWLIHRVRLVSRVSDKG